MSQGDIEFPDDITVQKAASMILDRCKKGYFYRGLWKGEEYYLCGGDCQSCSTQRVLKFLLEVTKAEKGKRG